MSCLVTEWYCDSSGNVFWPDTIVGSKLDYEIDWNTFLTNESDTFVSMVWGTLPTGLTSEYTLDSAGISIIQIEPSSAGTYEISGVMTCTESGHEQKLPVKMHLKVT